MIHRGPVPPDLVADPLTPGRLLNRHYHVRLAWQASMEALFKDQSTALQQVVMQTAALHITPAPTSMARRGNNDYHGL